MFEIFYKYTSSPEVYPFYLSFELESDALAYCADNSTEECEDFYGTILTYCKNEA